MKWIYLTYIILCPLFFIPGVEARTAQQLFYQLASVAVFAIGMFFPQRELKLSKINICLGIMLLAFLGAWLRVMNGWEIALNYLLGLLVYFTMIRTLKREDLNFLIKGITGILILAVIWLALQRLGFDLRGGIIRNSHNVCRNSFFWHASSMGMYFSQTIPLVMSFTWVGIFFIPILRFAECSSAYLATGISTLFFLWFRKRIVFWVLIPIMLIGGFYMTYNREAFTGLKIRLPLWGVLTQKIIQCPIGHGLNSFANPTLLGQCRYYVNHENYKLIVMRKTDKGFVSQDKIKVIPEQLHFYDTPHNEYIWLGYEIGLHALIILGFLFYFIWDRFKRSRKYALEVAFMASLVAVAFCSIGQFNLHLARVGYMLPILLGGFIISTEEDL